ncbi:MAG: glucose-6-phosphate isomerase, partial [Sphingomonadaceae bacterium]|nr:glucose-6-phosphate isomerase [Sphingomonadaceae bacterium]
MTRTLPQTSEWQALAAHATATAGHSILGMFDADPGRLARMSVDVAGLHFDFAKLRADARAVELLRGLADAADLDGWKRRLLAGEIVNPSERRAATHPAERSPGADHAPMRALVEAVRAGAHGDIRHILHIGIGGSALGPALLLDALGRHGDGPEVAVVANIDGVAL